MDGTFVSAEGRAQLFFQVYDNTYYHPLSYIKEGWRWLHALHTTMAGVDIDWTQLDDVIDAMIHTHPKLEGVKAAAPTADYRITGLKIAREPRRYSGRTAMRAPLSVHEPMQPKDLDTALTFSMEGYTGDKTPSSMIPFAQSPGWNSPQAWNKLQDKVGGQLKNGDPGIRIFDSITRLPARQYIAPAVAQTLSTDFNSGQAKLVPIYNIFASSPMASRSPIVAAQLPEPAWYVGAEDAAAWSILDGEYLQIDTDGQQISLPVMVVPYLAEGCIGYPAGQVTILHPGMPASARKIATPPPKAGVLMTDDLFSPGRNSDGGPDAISAQEV